MPRNYKTGPARSRRRPDPSTRVSPEQSFVMLQIGSATPGAGSLEMVFTPRSSADGSTFVDGYFRETGVQTNVRFVDFAGVSHTPIVTYTPAFNQISYNVTSGMAAGAANVLITAPDPAIRGSLSEWLGTYFDTQTVT